MKLSRMGLRRLIESVLKEQENPGSKFASSVKKGDQNKSAADKQKATQELQKTYDWFVEVVFPAIENNKWPIVADDDYKMVRNYILSNSFLIIPKGTKFNSPSEKTTWKWGGGFNAELSLSEIYHDLERNVIKHDLRVTMQSDQPEEFEKEVEKVKKDPKVQSEREKEIEDRGGTIPGDPEDQRINEGLSRGSLYRRRYRRY